MNSIQPQVALVSFKSEKKQKTKAEKKTGQSREI